MNHWQFEYIRLAFEHQHRLLHAILEEVSGHDVAKVDAITAKMKASGDALQAALAAVPPTP